MPEKGSRIQEEGQGIGVHSRLTDDRKQETISIPMAWAARDREETRERHIYSQTVTLR